MEKDEHRSVSPEGKACSFAPGDNKKFQGTRNLI